MRAAVFAEPGKIEIAQSARPADRPADRCRRARHARLRLRFGPVVLPRADSLRGGQARRPRVHRRGRGHRRRGSRTPQGRRRDRALRLQRRHLPSLPGRHHHGLPPRRLLGLRRHGRRPGRGRTRAVRRRHPGAHPRLRPLRRHDALAALALRRHGHGAPRSGQRRRKARALRSPWSAMARSASPA